MTKYEGAVLSAYTGLLLGDFSSMHRYAEKKLGRPIFTHEFGSKVVVAELKEASEQDFMEIIENQTD